MAIDSRTATVLSECVSAVMSGTLPYIFVAEIMRAPISDTDRRIEHDRRWLELARQERGQVNDRLERRARLAHGISGAIELTLAVVLAAR